MNYPTLKGIIRISFLLLFITFIAACKKNTTNQEKAIPKINLQPLGKNGKELSELYCSSCHQYPQPELLDKKTWMKEVLPNMGCRMGISTTGYYPMAGLSMSDQMYIDNEKVYPTEALIAQEDWQKIVDFYQKIAPESLKKATKQPLATKIGLPFFNIILPIIPATLPITTLTQINEKDGEIYIGNLFGQVSILNKKLELTDTFQLQHPSAHIFKHSTDNIYDILSIGQIRPNEDTQGSFEQINKQKHSHKTLISQLKRPVYFDEIDLDNNGEKELIVCQYGYQKGSFSWFEQVNEQWKEHIFNNIAGASKFFAYDFDKNGFQDLAVLMAQGDEHISILYNLDGKNFQEKQVLRFPPVYGSADFQLLDFNKDGAMDILYTNGDNADFSNILKPYHGIRLYLNDGKDNFFEKFFYPMYGAFQSAAADFDQDGDFDIIVSSFFPDKIDAPQSSILYLQQTTSMNFQPYSFKEAIKGKWLTLQIGDYDKDNDTDILIGSFLDFESSRSPNAKLIDKKLPFILLQNNLNYQ